jgi:hypothetical protein
MNGLSQREIAMTAGWLASVQLPNGMVPWYRGGHADPWNHMEATMALAAGERWDAVERAFEWLASSQLPDGSWCTFYVQDGVEDPRRDPNVCAYVATGAWWCYLLGGGRGALAVAWPMVDRAVSWCLRHQRPGGEFVWSVGPDAVEGGFALLAANCSLQQSLRSAASIAGLLGERRPSWQLAAREASDAAVRRPGSFAAKRRWAMDWYYPVLTGALEGNDARARLQARWDEFVMSGLGVRCVADQEWVTAAETAECAMAAARAGLPAPAEALLTSTRHLRDQDDGAYWTGCAHPGCVRFPGGQKSTYSAAAVLIADHVINRRSPAAGVFGAGPSLQAPAAGRRLGAAGLAPDLVAPDLVVPDLEPPALVPPAGALS